MTLKEYLQKTYGEANGRAILDFSKRARISVFATRKWLSGERLPRPENMIRIKKVTEGKVCSSDWIGD